MVKMHMLLCVTFFILHLSSLMLVTSSPSSSLHYKSIFSFGDSLADTGNGPVIFERLSIFNPVTRHPYGSTFFGRPSGRDCDGRLIIDFIAENLGLPYVPATQAHNGSFHQGANFAVAAATTLDAEFYHERDIPGAPSKFPLNTSLEVQLAWFESMKPYLCPTERECKEFFASSLFFVGEFGVNDYHFSFQKKTVQEVRSFVPDIVATLSMAIERLITKHGVRSLVVPGVIPSGCSPPILTKFADDSPAAYDSKTGCLKAYNEVGMHHNSLLQAALSKLQAKHRNVRIIYADYFGPVMEMVQSPHKFGFEDVLSVCCGGPGRYMYNASVRCGDAAAITCVDPSARLYWAGVHLTEVANRYIASRWMGKINSLARPSSKGAK
ncbi:GDSL esterase/lipase At5g45910-like [Hordeum vulgare subsp. vulgare]|uniref:GDSL esterase/lipase n=1 Tax=Hordeum vulgare subsp. vulgare TaxID=112509 RepID=A0A8I6WYF8_HORVV|nr:GDSL esterase/lipase At5g45910-like [Hordeum vulgare subsp. vulgare]